MIGLLVVLYFILTIVVGVREYKYLVAQEEYWNSIPKDDLENYEDPYETKFSYAVWIFPMAILVAFIIVKLKNR